MAAVRTCRAQIERPRPVPDTLRGCSISLSEPCTNCPNSRCRALSDTPVPVSTTSTTITWPGRSSAARLDGLEPRCWCFFFFFFAPSGAAPPPSGEAFPPAAGPPVLSRVLLSDEACAAWELAKDALARFGFGPAR